MVDPESEASGVETNTANVEKAVYESFPGLVLTDTFQSWEDDDHPDLNIFPENNARLERLKNLPITVIVGNPPWSVGQDSANDGNANEKYPALDEAIRSTYAERSTATLKNSLYDSYIRAIKWATLRIKDRGVIAFVTNGGWLTSNTADGVRKAVTDEFSAIYIYNLRGNRRAGGAEGRPIWEAFVKNQGGSIATVAITVFVKNPDHIGSANISYAQVGDYTSASEKAAEVVAAGTMSGIPGLRSIIPNEHGDWLNQRRGDFAAFMPIGGAGTSIFDLHSGGLKTNRDGWVWNFSQDVIRANLGVMIEHYNGLVDQFQTSGMSEAATWVDRDGSKFSWDRADFPRMERGVKYTVLPDGLRIGSYRPFTHEYVYFDRLLNNTVYQQQRIFPTSGHRNLGFTLTSPASHYDFCAIATTEIPDLHHLDTGQFFPRWTYESAEDAGMLDLATGDEEVVDGYRRIDNITDEALRRFQLSYRPNITKDDIFFYVYGLLHSPEYRETYAADLKKMLPRIPLVEVPWPFVEAGRELSQLHLGYESVTPYPLDGLDVEPTDDPYDFFAVRKMAFTKKRDLETKKLVADKSAIVYNSRITLSGIPEDAYRYMLGWRSAIEWIIDRYQVKTDKPSGIVNDPNVWSREVGDPRYIVDLLARMVTVSLQTMQIVDNLPALAIRKNQDPT